MIDPALSAESDQAAGDKLSTSAHTLSPQSTRKVVPTKIEEDEDSDDASDPDPIIGRFKILNKTTHSDNRTLTILEHTNKSDGKKPPRQPLELRAKPTTGMLELDLPVDYSSHYDRSKGLNWGAQLHKSTESKKGGSHGLAGGFGVGAPPPRASRGRGAAANAEDEILDMGMDWTEALRKDYVLRTQTLGGQVPEKGGESNYLVAVFSKGTSRWLFDSVSHRSTDSFCNGLQAHFTSFPPTLSSTSARSSTISTQLPSKSASPAAAAAPAVLLARELLLAKRPRAPFT